MASAEQVSSDKSLIKLGNESSGLDNSVTVLLLSSSKTHQEQFLQAITASHAERNEEHSTDIYIAQFANDYNPISIRATIYCTEIGGQCNELFDKLGFSAVVVLASQTGDNYIPDLQNNLTHMLKQDQKSAQIYLNALSSDDQDWMGQISSLAANFESEGVPPMNIHQQFDNEQYQRLIGQVLDSVFVENQSMQQGSFARSGELEQQVSQQSEIAQAVDIEVIQHSESQDIPTTNQPRASIKKTPPFRPKAVHSKSGPSRKYLQISINRRIVEQGMTIPRPTLPRKQAPARGCTRAAHKVPIESDLVGPGRAGKYGELLDKSGSVYRGEVLAGRPHGYGQYLMPGRLANQYEVEYEGQWEYGQRQGNGTRYMYSGEIYEGRFEKNQRHGQGIMRYLNGDVYHGNWDKDRRNGRGLLYFANGSIFEGTFCNEVREGLGTLFQIKQRRKQVSEYVNGTARSAVILPIDRHEIKKLTNDQKETISRIYSSMQDSGSLENVPDEVPVSDLQQNFQVLNKQIVEIRKERRIKSALKYKVQEFNGIFSDLELEMLRHSFILITGGAGLQNKLLKNQIRELCQMAELDPADPRTTQLIRNLYSNLEDDKIPFDIFLRIITYQSDGTKEQPMVLAGRQGHNADLSIQPSNLSTQLLSHHATQ